MKKLLLLLFLPLILIMISCADNNVVEVQFKSQEPYQVGFEKVDDGYLMVEQTGKSSHHIRIQEDSYLKFFLDPGNTEVQVRIWNETKGYEVATFFVTENIGPKEWSFLIYDME